MRHALFLLLGIATAAAAQAPAPRDSTPGAGPTCWRGRPLPHCESFWITDFTYGRRLGRGPDLFDDPFLTWEVGGMVNYGLRHAFGAAMVKSIGADRDYFGVRPRYRRWLGDETSLDLSLGVLVSGSHDAFRPQFPSFTAHAALSSSDLLGVTAGVEVIRGPRGRADVAWQGGARFGSQAALPASLLALMFLFAVAFGDGGT